MMHRFSAALQFSCIGDSKMKAIVKRNTFRQFCNEHDGLMFFECVLPAAFRRTFAHTRLFLFLAIFFGQACCIAANLQAQQSCANIDGVWRMEETATLACTVTVGG